MRMADENRPMKTKAAQRREKYQSVARDTQRVWDTVYAAAKKRGPQNPKGTPERAEELTRAYMSGYLRTQP